MSTFEEQLSASWPTERWLDRTVLLAVSGGADSVALLRAMHRLKSGGAGKLVVAHFNHGLRGAASDEDADFVESLARTHGLECYVGRYTKPVGEAASEDALRQARYQFLQETAERIGARYVATAHTADDQAETILHRILRGTGIAGLAGIPRVRPLGEATTLLRPMLEIKRTQVLAYLESLGQPYRADASNEALDYTRNRIRNQLLPHLASEYNVNIGDALVRLGKLAAETRCLVERLIEPMVAERVSQQGDEVVVDCSGFSEADKPLLREILAEVWKRQGWPQGDMGYREWDRLATLAISPTGQADFPGALRATKHQQWLKLKTLG